MEKYMIRVLFLYSFSLLFTLVSGAASSSDSFIQWHSSNIQLLRGYDYELGSDERTIVTFEHANSWKYGDFFVFADNIWPDDGSSTYYIEPTLRFSLSKMTGEKMSFGIIKDVLISTQVEKPKSQDTRKLAGVAFDLELPEFTFFKTNFFIRDNPDLSGDTYQVTLVWNRPFQIGNVRFLSEGFADFAGSEGTTVAHQLIVPRFLVDLGDISGIEKNKLWMGVEWQYWHNKFGVDGVTESVVQLQAKYVF